jgi:hypothetical protein
MAKKLTLLATAIAVLAFAAVPAFASAAKLEMTATGGGAVPVGTPITGISTDAITETSLGTLSCKEVVLNGEVTKNEATVAEGVGTSSSTTECFVEKEPINITDVTLINLKSAASGSGTASFSFVADLPASLTCTYTGTNAAFTYTPGGSVLAFSKAKLTASPTACGTAKLTGHFSLATSAGGAVIAN